jgi:hypothetical protein
MLITHELNVDDEKNSIINNDMVEKKILDSDDTVKVFNKESKTFDTIKLINISVKDQMLVIEGEKHHILHSLWKPEKDKTWN